jgi:predicted kinase
MHNWKRRRGGRRRKPTAQELPESTGRTGGTKPDLQGAPPPLQPMYPGMDESDEGDARDEGDAQAEFEPQPQRAGSEMGNPQTQTPAQKKSRRSRRGGRGRRGRRGGAASAPAVAVEQQAGETFNAVEAPARELPPPTPQPPHRPPHLAHAAPQPRPERLEIQAQAAPDFAPELRPAPVTAQRAPKGVVVLAIGLPGSGKTTWFKRRGVTPLSSDMLRTLLFDNITEQRYQHLVFSTLRSLLRARLIARMPWNYVDATNLNPKERRHWVQMAREFGFEAHAVFFDVPVEICMERNRRRQRVVPEEIMQRMAQKLRPPKFEEGFTKITVVRVKPREAGGDHEELEPEQ